MYNTPFDDAYKTIQEKYPSLLIPLVNEQFHTKYELSEPVVNLGQESHGVDGTIIADSVFRIRNRVYHVECQSNPDGTIVIRMLEYDFYIALKEAVKDADGFYHVRMPQSCILYLRHNSDTPKEEAVILEFANGEKIIYRVPVIKAQEYSVDEIFKKNLLILLPFYVLRYEKERKVLEFDEAALDAVTAEYQRIIEFCESLVTRRDIDGKRIAAELEILMKRITDYIFRKHSVVQQRIGGTIMGGTAWKTLGEELDELKQANAELERDKMEWERDKIEWERGKCVLRLLLSGKTKEEVARIENVSIEEIEALLK